MRGIRCEVRHVKSCPRYGMSAEDSRKPHNSNGHRPCNCEPLARVRLFHGGPWWSSDRLPKGWATTDVDALMLRAREERLKVDSGVIAAPTRIARTSVPTVAEWGEQCITAWGLALEAGEGNLTDHTWIIYRGRIRNYIAPPRSEHGIGDLLLTAVTSTEVRQLKAHMLKTRQSNTTDNVIVTLSRMFEEAIEAAERNGWNLHANPAKLLDKRKSRVSTGSIPAPALAGATDPKAIDLEVARLLLRKHHNTPFGELLWAAATMGLREAEIAGIFTENVRLADRRLWVGNQLVRTRKGSAKCYADAGPKYGSARFVPIYSRLAQRWMPLDGSDGRYWFTDNDQLDVGGPWQVRKMTATLSKSWDDLCEEYTHLPKRKPRQGWHAFRHLYSNLLDRNNVRETVRKAVMGHKEKGVSRGVYLEITNADLDVIEPIIDAAFGDLLLAPMTATPV